MNPITDRIMTLLRVEGPQSTTWLAERLGVGRSSVQRALRTLPGRVTGGRARTTRHALGREIRGVDTPILMHEVTDAPRLLGRLHPVHPYGFWFEDLTEPGASRWFDDLPWFLHDLRPAGYLGRQVPRRHPDLDVPEDIHRWTGDDVLRWATHPAFDGIGSLVLGDAPLLRLASGASNPPNVPALDRLRHYEERAVAALKLGPVGSSAAGEQPKFLTRVEGVDVLVKFGPPRSMGPVATRISDLLIAEHLALRTLEAHGRPAARSQVHMSDRVFLEIARFDRSPRRGQVMLAAADGEYVGVGTGWTRCVEGLVQEGLLTPEHLAETRWLALFGRWIANSDMHLGNLSLTLAGTHITGLAPVYDMLPMRFAPVAHELVDRPFEPTVDDTDAVRVREVHAAALTFWGCVRHDERVSADFRAIADRCRAALIELGPAVSWLTGAGR